MQREVVDHLIGVVEDRLLPLGEGHHLAVGAATGDDFELRVEELERLGHLRGESAVFVGGLVADLPRAVHLVAQAPHLDAIRLISAVFPAQVTQGRPTGMVAVLDQIACFGEPTGAEVDHHHRLTAYLPCPAHELIEAELVGIGGPPRQVQAGGALLLGPDGVLPVEVGDVVAAGEADHRHIELTHQRDDIAPHPLLIGARMSRLIDPSVHGASELLQEGAEDPLVHRSNDEMSSSTNNTLHALLLDYP